MPLLKQYPIVHSMKSIEAMRNDAQSFIDSKTKAACASDRELWAQAQAQAESMIAYAIAARYRNPPCPFCASGVLCPTGTEGRLGCVDCGAVALRGKHEAVVHVCDSSCGPTGGRMYDPALDNGDEGDADPKEG